MGSRQFTKELILHPRKPEDTQWFRDTKAAYIFLNLSFFPLKESKCGSEISHLSAKFCLLQPLAGADPIAVCISSLLVASWHASVFFSGLCSLENSTGQMSSLDAARWSEKEASSSLLTQSGFCLSALLFTSRDPALCAESCGNGVFTAD